jgi:hypothetical protein
MTYEDFVLGRELKWRICVFGLDRAFGFGSDWHKVNLIKYLFSGHRKAESQTSACVNWPGQSGKQYQFEVHSLDASFQPLPGVYIYAGQAEDGSWVPILNMLLSGRKMISSLPSTSLHECPSK